MDETRGTYKTEVEGIMTKRNDYRDKIEGRHEKMGVLSELLKQEKADIAALKTAVE